MTATLTMAPPQATRFHLSLNVSDLDRSVAFYRILFGTDPAKLRADYAKFELDDPPVVLSLEPTPRVTGGPLNHLGFRMPNAQALVAMQERLERAGIHSQREEGVECCYARQTKFWIYDPDRTLWEVYTLDEDIDHRGIGQLPEKVLPAAAPPHPTLSPSVGEGRVRGDSPVEPVVWEHRMGQDVPERVPFSDSSVDEVRLRGSFNLPLTDSQRKRLLAEARRVLRPGGRLFVHVLTADRPFAGDPDLPGPAAAVRHVPVDADVVALVEAAGFEGVRLLKFDAKPCFVRQDVPMRETQLEAWQPSASSRPSVTVIYKGPFRELCDDQGAVYPRGRRVTVDAGTADRLRSPEWAAQFLILG
jgi:catechol 2,3-dioxygenase-like lactoylglutathione lyase family enzyme